MTTQTIGQGVERLAYSEEEAATLLGVSKNTLKFERHRGRVEASKVGRRIRYTRQQLEDYLRRRVLPRIEDQQGS